MATRWEVARVPQLPMEVTASSGKDAPALVLHQESDRGGYLQPALRFSPVVVGALLCHAIELKTDVYQVEPQEEQLVEEDQQSRETKYQLSAYG